MSARVPELQEKDLAEVRDETTEPPMYRVMIHNDDYTTKEFVVEMLVAVFSKSVEEATGIMWTAHKNGAGLCGVYPYEVAETKVAQVIELARRHQHPLQCTMEKE